MTHTLIEGVGNALEATKREALVTIEGMVSSMIHALSTRVEPGEHRDNVLGALHMLKASLVRVGAAINTVLWTVYGKKLADVGGVTECCKALTTTYMAPGWICGPCSTFNSSWRVECKSCKHARCDVDQDHPWSCGCVNCSLMRQVVVTTLGWR